MKGISKIIIIFILVFLVGVVVFFLLKRSGEKPTNLESFEPQSEKERVGDKNNIMTLTSPAFANNQSIPSKYTCDGEDISPLFEITDVPEGAKSVVLIVDDPDAPMGTWDHWIIWNILPTISSIAEGSLPQGAKEGINSFGKQSYGGPCPPSGVHHYRFKLYALDSELTLDPSAKKKDLEAAMTGHILAETTLVGLYQRQ